MTQHARYDRIGDGYDITRKADPYLVARMTDLLGLRSGIRCLDLACGTGNYTSALSKPAREWWGVDASALMLDEAKGKSDRPHWLLGDAARLPFPDDSFDSALCTNAIHHFSSLEPPFREVARTLREGPFVIFTSTSEQTRGYWLDHYFPDAIGLSAKQLYSRDDIETALRAGGFFQIEVEPYDVREDLQDMFLYSGKHRPEAYLDSNFRAGISTFREWTEEAELETGLQRLEDDIRSGEIRRVVKNYASDRGDYLFIVAR